MSCVESRVREMKVRFNAELLKRHCDLKNTSSVFLTDERYYQLIKDVDSAKSKTKKKEPRDYWLHKKYDILVVNNNSKLIYPVKNNDNNILYYIKESDVFDVLHDAHQSLGHGGRDRMLYELNNVDRGRGEAHNVLACVLEVTEDGFYRLGNKTGVLKQLYARSQFTVCQQNFVALEEVNHEKELGLRSIATQEATGSGQGFIKCSCSTRCQNNRCKCLKNKVHCNSKCHPNLQCCNK